MLFFYQCSMQLPCLGSIYPGHDSGHELARTCQRIHDVTTVPVRGNGPIGGEVVKGDLLYYARLPSINDAGKTAKAPINARES